METLTLYCVYVKPVSQTLGEKKELLFVEWDEFNSVRVSLKEAA